jgi:hypothetical protein
MRTLLAFTFAIIATGALAAQVSPREPLPAGVPDRDTPGKPVAGGGMRYEYPYTLDQFGRYGLLDFCRDWGAACGKPAADAFCKQVDGGARPHAADFGHWPQAGHYAYTVVISTRDSCELQRCEAFTYIVCKK